MLEINEKYFIDEAMADNIEIYDFKYETDDKTCVQFKVKGLSDWLFGAWLQADNTIDCFVQHELFIDKFKPSHGYFNVKIKCYDNYMDFSYVKSYINFMREHEAIFFVSEGELLSINGKSERWYKRKMKKEIKYALDYQKKIKEMPDKLKFWFNIGAGFGLLSAIYRPDNINDGEYAHLNDVWYVLPHNKLGLLFTNWLCKKNNYCFCGNILEYKNELEWKVAALECYLTEDGEETEEDILKDCNKEIADLVAAGKLELYE